jgi:hypothetical protein
MFRYNSPLATNIITIRVDRWNCNHGRFLGASVMGALPMADETLKKDGEGQEDGEGNSGVGGHGLSVKITEGRDARGRARLIQVSDAAC